LRAEILELEVELVGDVMISHLRDEDRPRLGQSFNPRRDIDAVSENVAVLGDDIAEVDADAYRDALLFRQFPVPLCHRVAQRRGATRRLDDAVELDKQSFTSCADDAAAVFEDFRAEDHGRKGPQPGEAVLLVAGKQPVQSNEQYCRKPAPRAPSRLLRHETRPLIARCGNSRLPLGNYM